MEVNGLISILTFYLRFIFAYGCRIDFPREVIRGESLFTNLIIDETSSQPDNHCDDVFVYITDTAEPGELVDHKTISNTLRLRNIINSSLSYRRV